MNKTFEQYWADKISKADSIALESHLYSCKHEAAVAFNFAWERQQQIIGEKDKIISELQVKAAGHDCTHCSRKRRPLPLQAKDPFTSEELENRIDQICGCQGKHDCECVTIFNRARSQLWYLHNAGVEEPK